MVPTVLQGDRDKSLALLKLAEAQNFTAIVITVDSPHTGIRDRERRAFFHLPENMQHPHTPAHIPLPELHPCDVIPCRSNFH